MFLRCCLCAVIATFILHAQQGRGGRGGVLGQAGGQQAPPPPSDCAASGTVVNALTGEPIPRATVTLGQGNGSSTDSTGHWSITNTACGTRIPNASRQGFIPVSQVLQSVSARPKPIDLVSGTPVNNVKISLMPGGIITGSVRDPNGDPVESAQVRIMRVNVQQGRRVMNQQGGSSTDLEGNFRIGNLTPGHYVVCAESGQITYPVGGGEAMVYRESCFPGPAEMGLTNSLAVTAGQEVRTAFTLTAQRGVRIRGSISGAPEQSGPGRGGNVQLTPMPVGGGGGGIGRGGAVTREGTFEITGVHPGSYMLRATFPGGQQSGPQTGPPPSTQIQIEVGDSDLDNVILAFQTPGSIEGFVRYELSQAAQASGAANPNVNVNLTTATPGTPFFGPIPQAKWDTAHTNFTFADAPSGLYRLNASVNGGNAVPIGGNGAIVTPYGPASVNTGGTGVVGAYIKSATLRGQDVLNQGFSVDGKAGPIEVVVSDDVGAVDATVTDSDGKPVAASVMLLSKTGQRRIMTSGDDGHATSKNIPTGEYKAWAFDNINTVPYADDEWMSRNAGPGEPVPIASAGSANITLKLKAVPPE